MLLTILGRIARQVAKMTCGFVTPKKKGEQLDCYIFTVEKGNWKCLPCSNRGASPFSVRTHIDWVFFSSSSHVAQRFSWHSREIKIPFLDEWTQYRVRVSSEDPADSLCGESAGSMLEAAVFRAAVHTCR